MSEKMEYMVFVIKYKEKDKKTIENLVETFTTSINTRCGEIRRVYQGSKDKIISALESILGLTN